LKAFVFRVLRISYDAEKAIIKILLNNKNMITVKWGNLQYSGSGDFF
jgi:hypothetical protein